MKILKKYLFVIGLLIINISIVKAIETTAIRYGGASNDFFNDAILDGNDLVAIGYSKSTNILGINNNGGTDGIIVKYDINDNILWQTNYGTASDDEFKSIINVDDGYIVVGLKNGNNMNSTGIILKYNKDGNLVNELEYKIKDGTKLVDIEKDAFGNYFIIGNVYQNGDTNPLIIKYNKNNEKIFEKELVEYLDYNVKKIINSENGGYIILLTNREDSIIINIDSNGNEIWSYTYTMAISENPVFEDVILTSSKTYVVVGGNDFNATPGGSTSKDLAFMLEFDLNGNLLYEKIFKNYKQSRFTDIVEIEDRYVVLAQLANLEHVDVSVLSSKNFDLKILKFDYNKMLRDEISTGIKTTYSFYQDSLSLTKNGDNDYFIVLSVIDNLLDTEPKGNNDAAILKTKKVFGIEPDAILDVDEFKEVEVPDTDLSIISIIIVGVIVVIIGCLAYIIYLRKKQENKKSE